MQITTGGIQKSKTALHAAQSVLVFVGGCLTLAVLVKSGGYDGRSAYYFALCFFTIPAMLYLVMVPMWPRTARFANAYAFALLDALYTILWFAAFIAVACWNSAGMKKGASEANASSGNCSTFAYGSELKCKLSEATVGLGVVVFLLFIATSGLSFYYVAQYKRTGVLPIPANQIGPSYADLEASQTSYPPKADPADAVWDATTDDLDAAGNVTPMEFSAQSRNRADYMNSGANPTDYSYASETEYAGAGAGAGAGLGTSLGSQSEYSALHETDTDEGRHPGHPLSWGGNHPAFRVSTQGGGVVGESYPGAPSALSPTGYDEYRPGVNYSHF